MINHVRLRLAMICAALFVAVMMVAPSESSAQDPCQCEFINVNVDINVRCSVTLCALTPDGAKNCVTVAPGTRGRLRCIPGATIYIRDCNGNLISLTHSSRCTYGIGAGPNCCTVDACFDPNDVLCQTITITPSILDVCPCP